MPMPPVFALLTLFAVIPPLRKRETFEIWAGVFLETERIR
jgi:hypothetical protein